MNSAVICAVLVAGCLLAFCQAGPAVDHESGSLSNSIHTKDYDTVEESLMKKLNSKCSNRDVSSCMMLKLVTYFNRMLKKSSMQFGDVEITQTSTETFTEESGRSFNNENISEEAQLSRVLAEKAMSFIRTRSLKWKVLDEADLVISGGSDMEGGMKVSFSLRPSKAFADEARKKKDNGMGMMMAAAAMKMALMKALAFKALAMLVGKALLVSKLALVLAAIIGLKKLFSQEKHVTYEVVAHPHHESHHEHSFGGGGGGGGHDSYGGGGGGGGGWGRNLDAGNLAYRGHIPQA